MHSQNSYLTGSGIQAPDLFFQAEDGIRDVAVTGVQTCALPIFAVVTERRGQGLGAALTVAALDLARRRGVRTVYLLTETAGQFFPKFGFTAITRAQVEPAVLESPEFTTACPKSAIVMVKQL